MMLEENKSMVKEQAQRAEEQAREMLKDNAFAAKVSNVVCTLGPTHLRYRKYNNGHYIPVPESKSKLPCLALNRLKGIHILSCSSSSSTSSSASSSSILTSDHWISLPCTFGVGLRVENGCVIEDVDTWNFGHWFVPLYDRCSIQSPEDAIPCAWTWTAEAGIEERDREVAVVTIEFLCKELSLLLPALHGPTVVHATTLVEAKSSQHRGLFERTANKIQQLAEFAREKHCAEAVAVKMLQNQEFAALATKILCIMGEKGTFRDQNGRTTNVSHLRLNTFIEPTSKEILREIIEEILEKIQDPEEKERRRERFITISSPEQWVCLPCTGGNVLHIDNGRVVQCRSSYKDDDQSSPFYTRHGIKFMGQSVPYAWNNQEKNLLISVVSIDFLRKLLVDPPQVPAAVPAGPSAASTMSTISSDSFALASITSSPASNICSSTTDAAIQTSQNTPTFAAISAISVVSAVPADAEESRTAKRRAVDRRVGQEQVKRKRAEDAQLTEDTQRASTF